MLLLEPVYRRAVFIQSTNNLLKLDLNHQNGHLIARHPPTPSAALSIERAHCSGRAEACCAFLCVCETVISRHQLDEALAAALGTSVAARDEPNGKCAMDQLSHHRCWWSPPPPQPLAGFACASDAAATAVADGPQSSSASFAVPRTPRPPATSSRLRRRRTCSRATKFGAHSHDHWPLCSLDWSARQLGRELQLALVAMSLGRSSRQLREAAAATAAAAAKVRGMYPFRATCHRREADPAPFAILSRDHHAQFTSRERRVKLVGPRQKFGAGLH